MIELRAGSASVRVPATSANLGPGYDALGLALSLHDDVSASIVDAGLHISVTGEGADTIPVDESHLIILAMRATFDRMGARARGLALHSTNRIPHGRGLGSSAAAICAGILLARALTPGGTDILDDDAVLALATEIEGHPDNVAACLLGGLTIAWSDESVTRALGLDVHTRVRPVVFIPTFESSTEQARKLLPPLVAHVDAAFNSARAALLTAAMTVAPEYLLDATADRLHQPYRAPAMPESADLVAVLRALLVPAVISGAGPTVLALTSSIGQLEQARAQVPPGWQALNLTVDRAGAQVN
jgi:homoserine kinase